MPFACYELYTKISRHKTRQKQKAYSEAVEEVLYTAVHSVRMGSWNDIKDMFMQLL
jgi:hypothetical protein